MIIDFHTHTFPDKVAPAAIKKLSGLSHSLPFTEGTQTGLRSSMEQAGVDLSLILPVATSPGQVPAINDSAIRLNRREGFTVLGQETGKTGEEAEAEPRPRLRLLSCGAMHPFYEDWERELERIAAAGIPGIKIHPPYQDADLDDPRFVQILRKAESLGLITVTHAGWDIGLPDLQRCSPDMARNLLDQTGARRLVLAHMGGWRMWEEVCQKLADTPVYLDTSFSTDAITPLGDGFYQEKDLPLMGEEEFLHMVSVFGPDRLLFGTDSPWSSQKESLAFMRGLGLQEQELADILGGNAKKLLGLEKGPER